MSEAHAKQSLTFNGLQVSELYQQALYVNPRESAIYMALQKLRWSLTCAEAVI
jgi:hypothetical protein